MPPVMRHPSLRPAAGLAAAFLLAASPASASEAGRAERLYSKGLAALHSGDNEAALALFQQSVDADPSDVRALYYRALGLGRAGRYEEAAADLRLVVAAADPVLERDRLELGYALYRTGDLDGAASELEAAAGRERVAAEASMLLSIVEARRGNQAASIAAAARAERLDPSRAVAARYYQGLASWRSGDSAAAREHFSWVSTRGGDSPWAREATAFLDQLDRGTARRYRVYGGLAFEYDSNVSLAPDDNATQNLLGVSDKGDGRAVMTAGVRAALLSAGAFQVAGGYDFLQSLHFDLERFDVQTHRTGVDSTWSQGAVTLGLGTEYEYSLLDEDPLMHAVNLLPWARYDFGELGRSEAYYRMRWRDYVDSTFNPERDSTNHALGVRQFFSLGERYRNVILGYRYDRDVAARTVGDLFNYDGHQFEVGIEWGFDAGLTADLLYAYRLEDYAPASLYRDDDEHTVIARLEKRLHELVWLTGTYVYRQNQSDQKVFEYDRHVTSLGVEVRY